MRETKKRLEGNKKKVWVCDQGFGVGGLPERNCSSSSQESSPSESHLLPGLTFERKKERERDRERERGSERDRDRARRRERRALERAAPLGGCDVVVRGLGFGV